MKYVVSKISRCSCKQESDSLVINATGESGRLTIKIYSLDLIFVRYDIDSIKIADSVKQASEMLCGTFAENEISDKTDITGKVDNSDKACKSEEPDFTFNCQETDDYFYAECVSGSDNVLVSINKENANVTVERNGKIIHGGELGTKDTVLPKEQLRYFTTGKNAKTGRASFFFPLAKDDRFFGLGDKAGYPDRRMNRYRMYNRDSLGYDAEKSDPLYKSIPFFIKHNPVTDVLCGLYFPSPLIESIDFGKESPFYFSTEIAEGPMEYFVISGNDYKQIIQNYCRITGFPTLPPLFSFGFFGSSMNYVEPDNAQKRMEKYFSDIEEHEIPCEGMYVSSGYLKADDGKRYAFVWNKRKFPDYGKFLDDLGKRGYNLIMNIKPGILTTHPWYKELYDKGYFVKASDGKPCVVFYWGGNASFVDFSNPKAFEWWKNKLKEVFLSHPNCGIWNDNNELELEDPQSDAFKTRTLFSTKMCQASYEASLELNNNLRPWLTTRSGYAGIQKYSRTWSGDNVSDWKTLKFNQFQGWSLGLSALPFYGHDLGGFFGDVPSEELLIRSCQSAVFQPRFVIHSWRENGEPTEPWTYPDAFPVIRKFVLEHYRFIPYIYNCAYEAGKTGAPIERPLFLEYPQDKNVPVNSSHCMFGPSILKILIVDEGKTKTEVYLPKDTKWYDVQGEKLLNGNGNSVIFDIPLDSYAYLAKVPSVVPTAPELRSLKQGLFKKVEFLLFPDEEGTQFEYIYFEDSGRTIIADKKYNLWHVRMTFNKNSKTGTVEIENEYFGSKNDGFAAVQCAGNAKRREAEKDSLTDPGRSFTLKLPGKFRFENSCDSQTVSVDSVLKEKRIFKFTGSY